MKTFHNIVKNVKN